MSCVRVPQCHQMVASQVSRTGKYLKPTGRGTCPGLVVSVVVNTRAVGGEECDTRCRTREFHNVAVAWSYHSHGTWTPPRTLKMGDVDEFWRWLDGLGRPGRRVYVFSPIASDALTILRFWCRVDSAGGTAGAGSDGTDPRERDPDKLGGVRVSRLVLNGRPDVVGYGAGGCSYLWLSGRQFWDHPDAEVCRMFQSGAVPLDVAGATVLHGMYKAAGRALAWLRAMTTLASWWKTLGAGPFPRTLPSAAMQFFRSRMAPKSIVVHKDEQAYKLERMACYGGRASCWYYGIICPGGDISTVVDERPAGGPDAAVAGPVTHLDVRSMYPSLLRDRLYPIRLVLQRESISVSDLIDLTSRYGCIARVELDDYTGEYPSRNGSLVVYHMGKFRTVLCGPELARALSDRSVKRVFEVNCYEMGRPFERSAGELCDLREEYRRRGLHHWELLAKMIANSLAGKLAQRPRGWVELRGEGHYPEWDVWIEHNADTGVARRMRCIAGRVQEYTDIGVGQGTLTACFAFLTSYGRAMMRSYRETCPPFSVVSQDTDGIWVLPAGHAALRTAGAIPDSPTFGELCIKESSSTGYWLGPKHYRTDHGWILSGYHSPEAPAAGMVIDSYDINPARTGCTAPPTTLQHWTRYGSLPLPPGPGAVDLLGWAIPQAV